MQKSISNNIFSGERAQNLSSNFSKWSLMNKYFESKKDYYDGNPSISDEQFDSLEKSIEAIHGKEVILENGCVGYDANKHLYVKVVLDAFDYLVRKTITDPHNKKAMATIDVANVQVKVFKEEIRKPEAIEEVNLVDYNNDENGQFLMF